MPRLRPLVSGKESPQRSHRHTSACVSYACGRCRARVWHCRDCGDLLAYEDCRCPEEVPEEEEVLSYAPGGGCRETSVRNG